MKQLQTIQIEDLKLRTYVGIFEWEKNKKQDVVINVSFDYDASRAIKSDDIKDAVDYKSLKRAIIQLVENSRCQLIEKLASQVLDLIMGNRLIIKATVRIDKPLALRYAKSVAVVMTRSRKP